jgi:hypothetical protein
VGPVLLFSRSRMPRALPSPIVGTTSVESLVGDVVRGHVRVPVDACELRWTASEVLALLDSIYRGYPVGWLLLQRRSAPARTFELGPLRIHAPEQASALAVIDGQQRVVALAASLMRPDPIPTTPEDDHVVYFDPRAEQFCSPSESGEVPDIWVPLTRMSDPAKLMQWVFHWAHGGDERLRQVVFEASLRLRAYMIPTYCVCVDEQDSELLGEVFHRLNDSGKPLKWSVIHDALFSRAEADEPSTLAELGDALAELGMGRLDEQELRRCLIAFEGDDLTRSPDELSAGVTSRALPTLRRVFGFLRAQAEIPHLRLLPRAAPLAVLTRFFRLHPEPGARSLELLTRWLWRSLLAIELLDEQDLQRRGVSEIDEDEEASVQRLLACLPRDDPGTFRYPERFDAGAADTRIGLLGMCSLVPRDLETGRPLDVAALIEAAGREPFRKIVSWCVGELHASPANRILLPGTGEARGQLLAHLEAEDVAGIVSDSHGIMGEAGEALCLGLAERFLERRFARLREATLEFTAKLAAWGRSDRPSIDYLLESAE